MTWEWSHSQEAYDYAQEQVQKQSREWLEIVYAEWSALTRRDKDPGAFSEMKYTRALHRAKSWTDAELAAFIWNKMEELRDCTNGGFMAHCCPFGCIGHMVPFSPPEEKE